MLLISCFGLYKELAELKGKVEGLGIAPCCLSGSGAAMFCMFDNDDEGVAVESRRELGEKLGCGSIIVRNNRW